MKHADTLFSLRRCAWIAVVLATLGLGWAEPAPRLLETARNAERRSPAGAPAGRLERLRTLLAQPSRPLSAQTADAERTGGLRRIQPGHYVYLHTDDTPGVSSTFNSGIIVTSEGVVVIDALGSEEIARQVRQAIAQVTDQPVRFLVSSTFHGRFTGGNAVYQDAFDIGHEHYRTDLTGLLSDASPDDRAARLPDQTYRDRVTLHVGGKEIRILHLGRAHTRGDSIVFVPEDRIAYLSEVFNFDEFPYTRDSFPGDWLRTLEAAEALEADVFVPGHGFLPDDPRATRAGLQGHRQILLDVREAVHEQIDRGATADQAGGSVPLRPQGNRPEKRHHIQHRVTRSPSSETEQHRCRVGVQHQIDISRPEAHSRVGHEIQHRATGRTRHQDGHPPRLSSTARPVDPQSDRDPSSPDHRRAGAHDSGEIANEVEKEYRVAPDECQNPIHWVFRTILNADSGGR